MICTNLSNLLLKALNELYDQTNYSMKMRFSCLKNIASLISLVQHIANAVLRNKLDRLLCGVQLASVCAV